jgi:hypothetical protein
MPTENASDLGSCGITQTIGVGLEETRTEAGFKMMDGLSSLHAVVTDSSSTLRNPGESRFRENRGDDHAPGTLNSILKHAGA